MKYKIFSIIFTCFIGFVVLYFNNTQNTIIKVK